jgi:hypothetical protein
MQNGWKWGLFSQTTLKLRFSYQAFSGQFTANASDSADAGFYGYTEDFDLDDLTTTSANACTNLGEENAEYFGITQTAFANWFVITAVGNQVDDTTCSIFAKVNDRPAIFEDNATE